MNSVLVPLTTSWICAQYVLIRSLLPITINNSQPPKWIGNGFAHWPQGAIYHSNPFAVFASDQAWNAETVAQRANGQDPKTCVSASDTSLTISSLPTHAHYLCLVEQHPGLGGAPEEESAAPSRCEASHPCRPESRYDSALLPRPGSPITLLKRESLIAAASRLGSVCSAAAG